MSIDDCKFKIGITVNPEFVDSDIFAFPVYLDLSQEIFQHLHENCLPDGSDLCISTAGKDQCPVEVVGIDTVARTGGLHFLAPYIKRDNETQFWLYYGNENAVSLAADAPNGRNAVWAQNYVGVWHLNRNDQLEDSTGNGNDGLGTGTENTTGLLSNGVLGFGAQAFENQTNDQINCGDDATLEILDDDFSIECWIQLGDLGQAGERRQILYKKNGDKVYQLYLENLGADENRLTFEASTATASQKLQSIKLNLSANSADWIYLVLIVEKGAKKFKWFLNAALKNQDVFVHDFVPTAGGDFIIGGATLPEQVWDGKIEELRITKTRRKRAWIKLNYNHHKNTDKLISLSRPQTNGYYSWSAELPKFPWKQQDFAIVGWLDPRFGGDDQENQANLEKFIDTGMNLLTGHQNGFYSSYYKPSNSDKLQILASVPNHMVRTLVYENSVIGESFNEDRFKEVVDDYNSAPGLSDPLLLRSYIEGYFVVDEPHLDLDSLPKLSDDEKKKSLAQTFKKQNYLGQNDPAKLAYANLGPALMGTFTRRGVSFAQYVEDYVNAYAASPDSQMISYDIYPIGRNPEDGRLKYSKHLFRHLYAYAKASVAHKKPLWGMVLSAQQNRLEWLYPTEEILRYQVSALLIYGAKSIGWFVYERAWSDLNYQNSPEEDDALRNDIKTINLELKNMGPVLLELEWIDTVHGSDLDPFVEIKKEDEEAFRLHKINKDTPYFHRSVEEAIAVASIPDVKAEEFAIGIFKREKAVNPYLGIMNKNVFRKNEARFTVSGIYYPKVHRKQSMGWEPLAFVHGQDSTSFVLGIEAGDMELVWLDKKRHETSELIPISLQSYKGHFVSAIGGGNDVVNVNRETARSWETFWLRDLNGGQLRHGDRVQFLTHNQIHLLSAEDGGGKAVLANREEAYSWETFRLEKVHEEGEIHDGDLISLSIDKNGQTYYLSAEYGQDHPDPTHNGAPSYPLLADKTKRENWEIFKFHFRNKYPIHLRAQNLHYVTAEKGGGGQLTANAFEFHIQAISDRLGPLEGAPISGFSLGKEQDPRIYYQDAGGEIFELWWNGDRHKWQYRNPVLWAGAERNIPANLQIALTSFGVGPDLDPRVYYLTWDADENVKIVELAWNGKNWAFIVLDNAGEKAPAKANRLTGFAFGPKGYPRLYYFNLNQKICEWSYEESGWTQSILSERGGKGNKAKPGSPLVSLETGPNDHPRVYYLNIDNEICEFGWNGTQWLFRKPGTDIEAPKVAPQSDLVAFDIGGKAGLRLYFTDAQNHIIELGWDGKKWFHKDLSKLTDADDAADKSSLSVIGIGEKQDPRLYYINSDGGVCELAYLGLPGQEWQFQDLTQLTDFPPKKLIKEARVFALAVGKEGLPRVYFHAGIDLGLRKKIWLFELSWDGEKWTAKNLLETTIQQSPNWIGRHETFYLTDLSPGQLKSGDTVQLQAYDGQYLAAEGGGGREILANRTGTSSDWVNFTLNKLDGEGNVVEGTIRSGDAVSLTSVLGLPVSVDQYNNSLSNSPVWFRGAERFVIEF
jgi:hypothetical protein